MPQLTLGAEVDSGGLYKQSLIVVFFAKLDLLKESGGT